jgi:hypothetical protein
MITDWKDRKWQTYSFYRLSRSDPEQYDRSQISSDHIGLSPGSRRTAARHRLEESTSSSPAPQYPQRSR